MWVGRAGINRAVPGGSRCVCECVVVEKVVKRGVCVCVENVLQMLQDNTNLIWAVNHNQRVYRGREAERISRSTSVNKCCRRSLEMKEKEEEEEKKW